MNDNLKSPAYPDPMRAGNQSQHNQAPDKEPIGFTKIEKAALMIAAGLAANSLLVMDDKDMAKDSVSLAKAVLEEANK